MSAKIRRSMAVSTFGPGGIVDIRLQDKSTRSIVMAGIDQWSVLTQLQDGHPTTIHEPRLEAHLGVLRFHQPPVRLDDAKGNPAADCLPAYAFPRWSLCPQCNRISDTFPHDGDPDHGSHCPFCSNGADTIHVIPVRFVTICRNGHLNEFPWRYYLSRGGIHTCRHNHMTLKAEGPGLGALMLACRIPGCTTTPRSMEDAFQPQEIGKCSGSRPWLGKENNNHQEACNSLAMTVQRGASNVYFPATVSTLSIPDIQDPVLDAISGNRAAFNEQAAQRGRDGINQLVDLLWATFHARATGLGLDREGFRNRIWNALQGHDPHDVKGPEWSILAQQDRITAEDFEKTPRDVTSLRRFAVSTLSSIARLREVRALQGFTRVESIPDQAVTKQLVPLSIGAPGWLPAIEVHGEGLFFGLDEGRISSWEKNVPVMKRAAFLHRSLVAKIQQIDPQAQPQRDISPRYLLLHALAHAVMREIAIECGYGGASIRERIYAREPRSGIKPQAGIMIYTSTTDSEGTLGGLSRLADPDRFLPILERAIEAMRWCPQDPLCGMADMQAGAAEQVNLAACHGCLFVPETACEEFNSWLDRAMLVGTPEDPGVGFYNQPPIALPESL